MKKLIAIITNRADYTADFLILNLRKNGIRYWRFNTEDFPQQVTVNWQFNHREIQGYFVHPKGKIEFDEIGSIWYRRPVTPVPSDNVPIGPARDFCITESLEAIEGIWKTIDCLWVSKPENIRRAENKIHQLRVAAEIGFLVPKTLVTNNPLELSPFFDICAGNVIIKPLRRGRLKYTDGLKLIYTNRVTKEHLKMKSLLVYSPALFQEYIPKNLEVRITVIGDKVFTAAIHSQENGLTIDDWRRDQRFELKYCYHQLPFVVEDNCRKLVKKFNLQFGAIDMILTPKGEYYFLEINPNGQWAWIEQLTDQPMAESLVDLLMSGCGK